MTGVHRDILDALPHRPPFRFLSEVRDLRSEAWGEAIWRVSGGESFFEGHFPGQPVVPGLLITEALAQLSGLVGLYRGDAVDGRPDKTVRNPPRLGKLAHVEIRFKKSVIPPAEVQLTSRFERRTGDLWQFQVQASCAGREAARGRLTLAYVAEPAEPQP